MRPLAQMLRHQRGHLFEWVPVMLALGIGAFFSLRVEPTPVQLLILSGIAGPMAALGLIRRLPGAPVLLALGLVGLGCVLAGARAHWVAGPVLEWRYYGAISGRVVAIDRSGSDRLRLTLDRVALDRVAPAQTPHRVRISLHEQTLGMTRFVPGQVVMTTAHISPPQGPVEPGGFDFQRHAWFQRLGGVGYSRVPVLLSEPPEAGRALAVYRVRMAMSAWVQSRIKGPVGRVAAALMTGDRSGMDASTITNLRRTNLAHLLAISGLHMGLLTGFVFMVARLGLALVPMIALRWPIKKIAAAVAIAAGAGYLVLSGASVATERAFVMVAVMFTAVLLDRRALSLRAIALAATIVLVLRPESLLSPGFQMSFAATTALVAVFSALRALPLSRLPWLVRWVGTLVVSSAVAGAATAPFAAAHFNVFSSYGLLANLASVPVMGSVVMPGAVVAVLLSPFGLEGIGFAMMRLGLDWILSVAGYFAALEGAVRHIAQPGAPALPLVALGGLFAVLWQGWARYLGALPVLVALVLWTAPARPVLLVAGQGGLVGVLGPQGRALSRARGEGFSARVWLENDGDAATQEVAFTRADTAPSFVVGHTRVMHLHGKAARQATPTRCDEADILVVAATLSDAASWPCLVLDRTALRLSGAIKGQLIDGQLALTSVSDHRGRRLWSPPDPARAQ